MITKITEANQDLYYSLQKYPTEVKDNTIALYLLENN